MNLGDSYENIYKDIINIFLVTILFAGSLFAQTNYSILKSNDLTDSLIAYYPFNANTNDESGNGNDGINYGSVLTIDRFGNDSSAFYFDGVDDWIEAGLNIKEPTGTISMWFKAEELENSMLFCQIHHPNSPATLNYQLSVNGNDEGYLDIRSDAGIPAGISPKEVTTLNEWHHLVCIWGENGSKLYFDGELQDSTNLTYYDNSSTINMGIGCYNGHHPRAHYFHGSIDDMRIYSKALTQSEINELYQENGWAGNSLIENNIALSSLGASAWDNGSFSDYGTDQDAMHTIDDSSDTYWAGLQDSTPQTMWIEFDQKYSIDKIQIVENKADAIILSGTLKYYDGTDWHHLADIFKSEANYFIEFTSVEAEQIELQITSITAPGSWYNKVALIYAIEVNGTESLNKIENNIALSSIGATAWDNGSFSDYGIDQDAMHTIDDSSDTYWAGLQGSAPQTMWIEFDKKYSIDKIQIVENKADAIILTGTLKYYDGTDWHDLADISKSEANYFIEFSAVEAEQIELQITSITAPGSWYNKVALIYAVEVNGAESTNKIENNIALSSLGATAWDNGSFSDYGIDQDAIHTIDDSSDTYWAGLQDSTPQTMWIEFDKEYSIDKIRIVENKADAIILTGTLKYYDGTDWHHLADISKSEANYFVEFSAVDAEQIELQITSITAPGSWYNKVALIYAVEVNGKPLTDIAESNTGQKIKSFVLDQNYPNPFNPETIISFLLPASGNVKLTIYNTRGQRVSALLNEYHNAGKHIVKFNAAGLSSGVYLYKIETGSFVDVKRMLLIK